MEKITISTYVNKAVRAQLQKAVDKGFFKSVSEAAAACLECGSQFYTWKDQKIKHRKKPVKSKSTTNTSTGAMDLNNVTVAGHSYKILGRGSING